MKRKNSAVMDGLDYIDPDIRPLARPIGDLNPDPANARKHPDRNLEAIKSSLVRFGQKKPLVARPVNGNLIVVAGNGTLAAAKALGWTHMAVSVKEMSDAEATAYGIADNKTAELAEWDDEVLAGLLGSLDADLQVVTGFDDAEIQALISDAAGGLPTDEKGNVKLVDRFLVPPFSVLDARQGYWQERKRQWLALGIRSEIGRGEIENGLLGFSEQSRSHYATPGGSLLDATSLGVNGKTQRGDGTGKGLARTNGQDLMRGEHVVGQSKNSSRAIKDHAWLATHGKPHPQAGLTWVGGDREWDKLDETSRKNLAAQPQSGTSIFDPVLCELAYRWFCPPEGCILDPFAGGSVRGIVAAKLGRHYVGVDLSARQIEANREQAQAIVPETPPAWMVGDSSEIETLAIGAYDLIFSCPPYFDLEVYSDSKQDLSVMTWPEFLVAYRKIIAACVRMLKQNRFACFVVGDVRDEDGIYRNFTGETVRAFEDAGARLYNEAILVTALGSLPIRAGKQFDSGRKLGKTHQNVYVFCKGDPVKATAACGKIEINLEIEGADADQAQQ